MSDGIINGIEALDRMELDVIIVGRGGGSIEDLWAFNEEEVARAIFNCNTPIISAVGHETDTTIADFVADMRAPTPSAAAELAVFEYRMLEEQLENLRRRLYQNMAQKITISRMRLQTMKMWIQRISPENRLRENRMYTSELDQKLKQRMQHIFSEKKYQTAILAERMERVSPLRKLSSGYAYIENQNKKAITSVKQMKCKEEVTIHLLDGRVKAEITEVLKISD